MSKRQLFAAATFGQSAVRIDKEAGIIYGAAINTVGMAKGHGVQLDQSFVDEVARQGAEQGRTGIKVRFGHPTMCGNALLDAPFIGRAKNFSVDGDVARADIFLSNSAMDTPAGNLYERTLALAAEDPDMFGMSIVFTPGASFKVGEDGEKVFDGEAGFAEMAGDPFATVEKLHGVDVVDEPAANAGLFGSFDATQFAEVATDFLDNNERLWELIDQNPDVVKQFMARYKSRHERNSEEEMEADTTSTDAADEIVETVEEVETTETFAAEPAEVVEVAEQPADFKAMYDAYGSAFAEYAHAEGFTDAEAKEAYTAHLQDRVSDLEAQLNAAHDEIGEDDPAGFAAVADEVTTEAALIAEKRSKYEGRTTDGVATFASRITLPKE
jgi:hypothetical protein